MEFIPIQDDLLVNPEMISVIERQVDVDYLGNKTVSISVVIEGIRYQVTTPVSFFFGTLNKIGVDLTKQFTSV